MGAGAAAGADIGADAGADEDAGCSGAAGAGVIGGIWGLSLLSITLMLQEVLLFYKPATGGWGALAAW
jgi:hypothetical protein